MSGHPCGAQGGWSPVRFTPDSNAYYTVQGISTSIKYGGEDGGFEKFASEEDDKYYKYDK